MAESLVLMVNVTVKMRNQVNEVNTKIYKTQKLTQKIYETHERADLRGS